jgi:hypothetical protein
MRLGDIFDEGTSEHRVSIDDTMAANGFHKLGDGIDSLVYAKDEGRVVKILAPMNDDLRGAKFPIMSLYLFSRQHPDNPYLPKFYPVDGKPWKDFYIGTDRFVEIHMERLQPFPRKNAMGQLLVQMIAIASHGKTWEQFVERYTNFSKMPIYDSNLPVVLKKVLESPEHKKMFKGIFDTAVQLVALGDKRGYEIDMHLDNIMLRGNTPVITDPWVADFREVK